MFNFLQPNYLFLLPVIAVILLVLALQAQVRRRRKLQQLLGKDAADPHAVKLSLARRWWRWIFLVLASSALVMAASRPYRHADKVDLGTKGRDFIVLFDVSKSMLATDLAPSRMEHAKFLLRQVVKTDSGDRFGLVAFAGSAYLSCPLTADPVAFEQYIAEISPDSVPVGGTNLELALQTAQRAFKAAEGNHRAIIILTDGDEISGDATRQLAALKEQQIPLLVVGLGNPAIGAPIPDGAGHHRRDAQGKLIVSKLNEAMLQKMALATGGIYIRSTVTDLGLVPLQQRMLAVSRGDRDNAMRSIPAEDFPLFLIFSAICWIFYLVLSERPRHKGKILALLLAGITVIGATGATPKSALPPPAPAPAPVPAKPEVLPTDPVALYNVARQRQLLGQKNFMPLYEKVLHQVSSTSETAARCYQNIGVELFNQLQKKAQGAYAKLAQEQRDAAVQELSALTAPGKEVENFLQLAHRPGRERGATVMPLFAQLDAFHRRNSTLQNQIKQLDAQLKQAREITKQAWGQQQKQLNAPNVFQAAAIAQKIAQARPVVTKLRTLAEELQQKNLTKRATIACQELQKAEQARLQKQPIQVEQHLAKAVKALEDPKQKPPKQSKQNKSNQNQSDQSKQNKADNSKQNKSDQNKSDKSKQNKSAQSKQNKSDQSKQNKSDQSKQNKSDQSKQKQSKPQKSPQNSPDQPLPAMQKNSATPQVASPQAARPTDKKGQQQLFELIRNEEKALKDKIKAVRHQQRPRVEKDW